MVAYALDCVEKEDTHELVTSVDCVEEGNNCEVVTSLDKDKWKNAMDNQTCEKWLDVNGSTRIKRCSYMET